MSRWVRTPVRLRLLAVLGAVLLLVASAIAIDRARDRATDAAVADLPAVVSPAPTETPGADEPTGAPSPSVQVTGALTDPGTAEAVGADRLLEAGLTATEGPWNDLGRDAWPAAAPRPVYVGAVELSPAGDRVTGDVVIAHRLPAATAAVTLRLLPAARALEEATLEVATRVDGRDVEAVVDRDAATLRIPLGGEQAADTAVTIRVQLSYQLLPADRITDDGGPAGFGLLAASPQVSTLGHWLPLLTLPGEDGPLVAWGDIGGFPAAVWSVQTRHDGLLVTGGRDEPCPEPSEARTCTWSRGVALRDLGAALFPADATVASTEVDGTTYRAVAPAGTAGDAEAVLDEAVESARSFQRRFGPLAWREVDTVAVPLGTGAAGMEFPGLSLVDVDAWSTVGGGFGTAVVAHELGHQWFHALVGNGSLTAPVVDESLAQYLTYLYWRDAYGDEAADTFADRAFRQRMAAAREEGVVDEPPGQPSGDFADAEAYGPLVYARAPQAWLAAEEAVGVAAVEDFVGGLVDRYGLGVVTTDQVVRDGYAADPGLGAVLERYWLDPAPIG